MAPMLVLGRGGGVEGTGCVGAAGAVTSTAALGSTFGAGAGWRAYGGLMGECRCCGRAGVDRVCARRR